MNILTSEGILLLNPNHSGIKSSYDFSPLTVSGLEVWLDADKDVYKTSTGTVSGNGDEVGYWMDQSGNGNHAFQSTGTMRPTLQTYSPFGGNWIHFSGSNVMSINDDSSYKSETITVFVIAQSDDSSLNSMLINYPHDVTHSSPYFRWAIYNKTDHAIGVYTNGLSHDSIINSWWRKPMIYAVEIGATDKIWLGSRQYFSEAAASITYPNAVGLYIGGRVGAGGNFLKGYIKQILIYSRSLTAYERNRIIEYLTMDAWPTFPLGNVHYYSEVLGVSDTGDASINHPDVVFNDVNMYYMVFNGLDSSNKGIHIASSKDAINFDYTVKIIDDKGIFGGWRESNTYSSRILKVGSIYYLFATGQNSSNETSIGVFTNSGNITDPNDWIEASGNPKIAHDAIAGHTRVNDADIMYFSSGYDPGTGDGSHSYWMIFGSDDNSSSRIWRLYLAYADIPNGTWTVANGGDSILSVLESGGVAPAYLWPGDTFKLNSSLFWRLQSYGSLTDDGYDGYGYCMWTFSEDLNGTWYFHPDTGWLNPTLVGDKRMIECSLLKIGAKLYVYTANDSDVSGSRDRAYLSREKIRYAIDILR